MTAELWTPADGVAPELTGDVALPSGVKVRHRVCDFCGARFAWHDESKFMRHFEGCWKKGGEDAVGAEIEMRRNDPIASGDHEQVAFLRKQAAERKDTSVKGVAGWGERQRREDARRKK